MATCGATRLLIPSFLVGLTVATVAGNDTYGWIAAAVTGAALFAAQRVRGVRSTCAISPPALDDRVDEERRNIPSS